MEVLQPLAPNEKFEVVLSETRSSTWEETVEKENEVTRDESVETHDENELTDRVANMLSKTATRTLSASGSTNWITGSASGNASETVADSSSRAVETTTRRLQEITKKQAEQIKQKVKITTRLVETQATSSTTRHVIENKSNSPVNYGLRRLYYDVNVKLQDLGPVLVWQTIVHNPGQRLAMPVLVDDPRKQDLPELPVVRHGVFTGQDTRDPAKDDYARTFLFSLDKTIPPCFTEKQKVKFQQNSADVLKLHLNKIRVFSLRGTTGQKKEELRFEIAAVSIDNAFRLSIAGRVFDRSDHFIMAEIELAFEVVPTQEELKEAEETIAAAKSAAAIKYIEMRYRGLAQLERDKLEYEERKILLGMALAQLVVPSSSQFPDLEAALAQIWENLDRVFDWSQMFYRQDVLEWREMKRIAALTAGTPKQYEIHSLQKHAAPLGSSLNWDTQLDGDDKRNAFLNAPWIKVCIPVKEGSEETALQLLKSFGVVSIVDNSAAKIQCELKAFRTAAKSVSRRNIVQDMAVTKNTPIAEQIRPWLANCETMSEVEYEKLGWYDVYPIISQQHVVIPVNGYMFDEIVVDNDGKWNDSSPRKSETRRGWWWNFLWS